MSEQTPAATRGRGLVQPVPDRHSHRWHRIWDVLRLTQPSAPPESERKCNVTCCTVTSPGTSGILYLAYGKSEHTLFTDKRMERFSNKTWVRLSQVYLKKKLRHPSITFTGKPRHYVRLVQNWLQLSVVAGTCSINRHSTALARYL